jgi:hypothetical protein
MESARPHTGVFPHPEIVIHGAPGWKLAWKKTPLAAGAQQIENHVDHGTNIGGAWPPAGFGCRQKWGEQCPCCVTHVRGIVIVWQPPLTEATLFPCKVGLKLLKHLLILIALFPLIKLHDKLSYLPRS